MERPSRAGALRRLPFGGRASLRGAPTIPRASNLCGAIDDLHKAVPIAGIAVAKGADRLLMPVSARRQLVDLSHEMATRIDVQYYADARDALVKALLD